MDTTHGNAIVPLCPPCYTRHNMNHQNTQSARDQNVGTEETSFKLSPLLSESEMDAL